MCTFCGQITDIVSAVCGQTTNTVVKVLCYQTIDTVVSTFCGQAIDIVSAVCGQTTNIVVTVLCCHPIDIVGSVLFVVRPFTVDSEVGRESFSHGPIYIYIGPCLFYSLSSGTVDTEICRATKVLLPCNSYGNGLSCCSHDSCCDC